MNSLNGLKHEKGQNKNKNFRHSTTLKATNVKEITIRSMISRPKPKPSVVLRPQKTGENVVDYGCFTTIYKCSVELFYKLKGKMIDR